MLSISLVVTVIVTTPIRPNHIPVAHGHQDEHRWSGTLDEPQAATTVAVVPTPPTASAQSGLWNVVRRTREDLTLRREADMMGFYLAIALLAALTAGNDHTAHTQLDVLKVVWGTTVGLGLAHWFAITVSARLVRDPDMHHTPLELLYSQMAMGTLLAVVATLIVIILPDDFERLGVRLAAALSIGVIVEIESRAGGSTVRTAVLRGALALVVAFIIATIKWFIGK
jgi:hypothetical protein